MAFSTGGAKGVKADINVTPLVDVVLVLLIIFMVITPMLQRGKDVRLPPAKSFEKEKDADPIILSMTQDKQLYFESDQYKSEAELAERLKQEIAKDPTKPIMLKGDERLQYGEVRKVLNRLKEAGIKGIGLSVEVSKPKDGS